MATPKDLSSGMVFDSIMQLVKGKAGEPALEKLKKERNLTRKTVSLLKYPSERFIDLMDGAVDVLRPVENRDDEHLLEMIGACTVEPWLDSPMGRVGLSINGSNAQRLLSAFPTAFRTIHTFGEYQYERVEERSCQLVFKNFLLGPAYVAGIMRVTLKKVVNVDADIQTLNRQADGCDFTLVCKW